MGGITTLVSIAIPLPRLPRFAVSDGLVPTKLPWKTREPAGETLGDTAADDVALVGSGTPDLDSYRRSAEDAVASS